MAAVVVPKPSPAWFAFVLASLSAFAPMSVDMYLPSWPTLAAALDAPAAQVQLSLSAFLVGFGVGQLFYGPAADRFGRKPPLYFGCVLFTAASLGCVFVQDIGWFILLRFIQAIGACAGAVLSRAMIRDRFERDDAARMLSLLMLIMGVVPTLAPLVGGQLLRLFGWRAIFVVLTGFGVFAFLLTWLGVDETLPAERRTRLSPASALTAFWMVLRDRRFRGYVLTNSFVYGGLFAYLSGTPFIYIELHHIPADRYGLLFGVNVLGLMAGSYVNTRLVEPLGVDRLLRLGLISASLAGGALALVAAAGLGGLPAIIVTILWFLTSLSFIGANATAGALALFPTLAGTAAALAGAAVFAFGALSGALVGHWRDGTARPMAFTIAACAVAGLISYVRLLHFTPPPSERLRAAPEH